MEAKLLKEFVHNDNEELGFYNRDYKNIQSIINTFVLNKFFNINLNNNYLKISKVYLVYLKDYFKSQKINH